MKTLTVISTSFIALVGCVSEPTIQEQWLKKDLSANQRDKLVELSKNEPFEKIAPTIIRAFNENQPFYGINPVGEKPWNNDRLTPNDRLYIMAGMVWQHHMNTRNDPAKAKTMLALLQNTALKEEKLFLITYITYDMWCPEAEEYLAKLARDLKNPLDLRQHAVVALLNKCDINKYMPLGIAIIRAHKEGLPRSQAFNSVTNMGNRLFTLNRGTMSSVLSVGFKILSDLPENKLRDGYFVARQLGYILKEKNGFAPDQKAKKYQGKHGLTDEFFTDTVENALNWYSQNMK